MSSILPSISTNNEETLNYIQELQTIEQGIFTNLEQNGSSMTQAEQNQLLQQMNDISQMRINLYQSLSGLNSLFQNSLTNSRDTLDEQIVAIGIVEEQLNEAKTRLQLLEQEKNNNIRSIEINEYYSERYGMHTRLMKIIIFMLVPIIILAILYNKGILPKFIYLGLIGVIGVIGFYFLFTTYSSMIRRDNMNYQQIDWNFNPNNVNTSTTSSNQIVDSSNNSNNSDPWESSSSSICTGAACCNTYETFDASLNKCQILATSYGTRETNSTSGTNLNANVTTDTS
jgi:hypothetical protein